MNETMDFFYNKLTSKGFDEREGQQDMAFNIMKEAIAGKKHVIVEASVGIGKSYAYFIRITKKLFCGLKSTA